MAPLAVEDTALPSGVRALSPDGTGAETAEPRSGDGKRLQSLEWFAPHQPRLTHHLFYEAFEMDLAQTTRLNPVRASATPKPRATALADALRS